MSEQNTQTKELMTMFPELSDEVADRVDEEMKTKVSAQTGIKEQEAADYLEKLLEEVTLNFRTPEDLKVKCKELARLYIVNEDEYGLLEDWIGFFLFVASNISLILRSVKISTLESDCIMFITYIPLLALSLFFSSGKRVYCVKLRTFLKAFNMQVSTVTALEMIAFYSICAYHPECAILWPIPVLISFALLLISTSVWYKRFRKK